MKNTHTAGFLTTCKYQTGHIVQSRPDGVANSILAVGRDDYLQADTAISCLIRFVRFLRGSGLANPGLFNLMLP